MVGLGELSKALSDLPKSTARNTLKRALKSAGQLFADEAQAQAPQLSGHLKTSLIVGEKLTRRQAQALKPEGKYFARVSVGTSDPAGQMQEFGTFKDQPQPFMRPAWDTTKDNVLAKVGDVLGDEIEKSRVRLARKAARIAAKGK